MRPQGAMTSFRYKGKTLEGDCRTGQIEAFSAYEARVQLRRKSVIALSLTPLLPSGISWSKPINRQDINSFVTQLATLINSGVPLLNCLDITYSSTNNASVANLLKTIRDDLTAGSDLATALSRHPQQFDPFFCQLVKSAELSAMRGPTLNRLVNDRAKHEERVSAIKKALVYPSAVLGLTLIVTLLLLIEVVPIFATSFADFNADLPTSTLTLLAVSQFLQDHSGLLTASTLFIVLVSRWSLGHSRELPIALDGLLYKMPLLSRMRQEAGAASFCRTLSTSIAAGVPLVDALDTVAECSRSKVYANAVQQLKAKLVAGDTMSTALLSVALFPSILQQFVAIGEQCAALEKMLYTAALQFENTLDTTIQTLLHLLEPAMMIVLAGLVGAIILALYLPIFELGSVM